MNRYPYSSCPPAATPGLGVALPFMGEVSETQLLMVAGAALLLYFLMQRGTKRRRSAAAIKRVTSTTYARK